MESNTKTIAKRARVEPRTQVHMTMEMLFLMRIPSISVRGSDMIVLDNVLKICLELIKPSNDNAMEKFYSLRMFQKLIILVEISKISKNPLFLKNVSREAPALRVIRAGTRLTVHRSLP